MTCLMVHTFSSTLFSRSAQCVPRRAASVFNIKSFWLQLETRTLKSRAKFNEGGIYRDGSRAAFREMRDAAGLGPGTPSPGEAKGGMGKGNGES